MIENQQYNGCSSMLNDIVILTCFTHISLILYSQLYQFYCGNLVGRCVRKIHAFYDPAYVIKDQDICFD